MEILNAVKEILTYGEVCDNCLGRFFGKRSFGITNNYRGQGLRTAHHLSENTPWAGQNGQCPICQDILKDFEVWAEKVILALKDIQCRTFLLGSKIPPIISETEEMVWSDLSLESPEPIKAEINREVGKIVSLKRDLEVDFKNPEVVILLNINEGRTSVQINSLYFKGRYRKFERGIPQTHWNCRNCQGKGCERCGFSGKQYNTSVEELIGEEVITTFDAKGVLLHGSGREDIDARMLGTGRPFIMEIVQPKIRESNLSLLEKAINLKAAGRVEIDISGWTHKDEVETLKSDKSHKRYRIIVSTDGILSRETLDNALAELKNATIHQRTPVRVSHRRADKIRDRRVIDIVCINENSLNFTLEVTGEAGLYIKELISGDEGRTIPSLTQLTGVNARVVTLDVIAVGTKEETNGTP